MRPALPSSRTFVLSALAAVPFGAAIGQGPPPTPELGAGPWTLETGTATVEVEVLARGLDHPWGLAFLPDGDILITERAARLRVLRDGALDPEPVAGLPDIRTAVIGGLLDIALHPDFDSNRLIYFSYSKPDTDQPYLATTAVARARWDGGNALSDLEDIWVADAWYSSDIAGSNNRCCGQGPADGSYGSRIVFDDDGYLFVTSGDRNWGERAQDPGSHLGKIVRLHDDGTIPEDNPFVSTPGFLPDIYSLGHRNPLGLTIHPKSREIWSTEFGPRGGDELNRITAGGNYGWILVTEGDHYNDDPVEIGRNSVDGMIDPVLFWVPSINPGNLAFVASEQFPDWEGNMLMAAMSRNLLRVTFDETGAPVAQERMLTELGQRLRDVRVGPDGHVYILTDETDGALLRMKPANPDNRP